MAEAIQVRSDVRITRNQGFLDIAESLRPALVAVPQSPVSVVEAGLDPESCSGWKIASREGISALYGRDLKSGDAAIVDMGDHHVGFFHFTCRAIGSPPDAPAHIEIIFGETLAEVKEPFSGYDGWLSSSWLQREDIYLDVLPATVRLPRRYCCRYVKIVLKAASKKYRVRFDDIGFEAVSSADMDACAPFLTDDPQLAEIDRVSVKTLHDCMQSVFEDGPKRDRRLWLGDLHLQALVNYQTFSQNDLVKRCLYLFAGVVDQYGQVSANLFMQPEIAPDDTYLYDYSLLFMATLADYYEATGDVGTLHDLWPTAWRQIELGIGRLDGNGIVRDADDWWAFVDWHDALNKQTPAQGVLLFCLDKAKRIAPFCDPQRTAIIDGMAEKIRSDSFDHLWCGKDGWFTSGKERQVSCHSQIWMVLGGVGDFAFRRALMLRLAKEPPTIRMATPYMMHHYVEALFSVGEETLAFEEIGKYWGSMLERGADTFWELFDPENPDFSPYGSKLINSYCHAWSCTPAYFIRRHAAR